MRIQAPLCAAALVALLAPSLRSQVQVFGGPDADRRASTAILFGADMMAGLSISYSQPQWKDEYNQMLDTLKGKNVRLGKNWWTSFDTSTALELGGTRIDAGSYFLGLHCSQDGKFSLLVFEAGKAMKSGMMPFATDGWKGSTAIALELRKDALEQSADRMKITIEVDKEDPTKGRFSIQWGRHELRADAKLHLGKPGGEKSK